MKLIIRLRRACARLLWGPHISPDFTGPLLRLGSGYGGWVLSAEHLPFGSTVLSCGLGEDASFDVEVAARFNARVVIADPTPRAIAHFQRLAERLGSPSERAYSTDGQQPVEAYDLTSVSAGQLVLVEKALTESNGVVRFYEPPNPGDVSHSVVNFQNDYSSSTPFIEVEGIDVSSLLAEVGVSAPALAKFDIEGAEILVIPNMLRAGIRPGQVLVEFDELSRPSRRARRNFDGVHRQLMAAGYRPIHFDRRTCVTYLQEGRA